jgi:hypothetical protein
MVEADGAKSSWLASGKSPGLASSNRASPRRLVRGASIRSKEGQRHDCDWLVYAESEAKRRMGNGVAMVRRDMPRRKRERNRSTDKFSSLNEAENPASPTVQSCIWFPFATREAYISIHIDIFMRRPVAEIYATFVGVAYVGRSTTPKVRDFPTYAPRCFSCVSLALTCLALLWDSSAPVQSSSSLALSTPVEPGTILSFAHTRRLLSYLRGPTHFQARPSVLPASRCLPRGATPTSPDHPIPVPSLLPRSCKLAFPAQRLG